MFKNLFLRKSAPKTLVHKNTFRPEMEDLEARIVPAVVSVSDGWSAGEVLIRGDNGADNISITDNGTDDIDITFLTKRGTESRTLTNVLFLTIVTEGGDDTVTYNMTSSTSSRRWLFLDVDMGSGNDQFEAEFNGSNIQRNSLLNIYVNGGSGSDDIDINAYGTPSDRSHIRAGSVLSLTLIGGSDLPWMDGNDDIRVRYRGDVDGLLQLRAAGGVGNDDIDVLIEILSGSRGKLEGLGGGYATVEGSDGKDRLDFRVRDYSPGTFRTAARVDLGFNDGDVDEVEYTSRTVGLRNVETDDWWDPFDKADKVYRVN